MPNTDSQPQLGLRIRKKRATENAIEVSAVSLALEHGIEHVTVEMICEQADISRSTFFNYFAGRDYAIVGRAVEPLQGEEAAAVLASAAGDLVRGAIRLIFASIGHQHVNSEVARKRAQLSAEQPAALQLASGILVEGSVKLIPVIAGWLAEHPEHAKLADPVQEATFAVGLAHAALGALISAMAQQDGDIAAGDAHVDDVLDQMRSVLG
ncbi:TetR/AcrR family transcriptional regulator [Leucobacter sp. Z1108]|uniref:TetR/AcrR family transcriptional regulator n=1 Tax=unclassified Leucobacter TaxID=2621730 RepID=UPI003D97DA55